MVFVKIPGFRATPIAIVPRESPVGIGLDYKDHRLCRGRLLRRWKGRGVRNASGNSPDAEQNLLPALVADYVVGLVAAPEIDRSNPGVLGRPSMWLRLLFFVS
jgi:hypothetical protein